VRAAHKGPDKACVNKLQVHNAENLRTAQCAMDRAGVEQSEPGLLLYVLPHAAAAVLFGCLLYWALQPIVIHNPGLSDYGTRRAGPIIARKAAMADDARQTRVVEEIAHQENQLLGLAPPAPLSEPSRSEHANAAPRQKPRRPPISRRQIQERVPAWTVNHHDTRSWFNW
jgi:hypothetical protein